MDRLAVWAKCETGDARIPPGHHHCLVPPPCSMGWEQGSERPGISSVRDNNKGIASIHTHL